MDTYIPCLKIETYWNDYTMNFSRINPDRYFCASYAKDACTSSSSSVQKFFERKYNNNWRELRDYVGYNNVFLHDNILFFYIFKRDLVFFLCTKKII